MAKKSIPSCRRASSPIPMPLSKRSNPSCKARGILRFSLIPPLSLPRKAGTTGPVVPDSGGARLRVPCLQQSRYSKVPAILCCSRRVMGAWWSPRSSKPSSARFTGRGMFDSYPLRQFKCRMRSAECGRHARCSLFHSALRTPRSEKGGVAHVARADL